KTSHSPASPLPIHLLMLAKRRDLPLARCSACNASIARGDRTGIVPSANARMHLTRKQSYEGSRAGAGSPSLLASAQPVGAARPAAGSAGWGRRRRWGRARPSLADAAWAELHADPRTGGPGGLGDRVFPGALAAAAHDQQVAVAEVVPDRGPATAWA